MTTPTQAGTVLDAESVARALASGSQISTFQVAAGVNAAPSTFFRGDGTWADPLLVAAVRGMTWATDTFNGTNLNQYFSQRPTIFVDGGASGSLGYGTFAQPYTTGAQIMNAVAGNMSDAVIGFKRGSTLRLTAELALTIYGTASHPVIFCPYGDAEALPIITLGRVVTSWSQVSASANIWAVHVAADCDCWENGTRLTKVTFSSSAVNTLTTAGTATYSSNVLYIRPIAMNPPNGGQMEVNDQADGGSGIHVTYTNTVAATGHIWFAGLNIMKPALHALFIERPANGIGSATSVDDIVVAGCKLGQAGVNKSGGNGGGLSWWGLGEASGLRLTNAKALGNELYDCVNNAIEQAGHNGTIIRNNYGHNVGGNSIVEWWANNSNCVAQYNIGYIASAQTLLASSGSGSGIWWNNLSGDNWDVEDTGNTLNSANKASFNLIIAPGLRGLRFNGGTGHKAYQNTIVLNGDLSQAASGQGEADGWSTVGNAANGFVDISNNILYWVKSTLWSNRFGSYLRIVQALGSVGSVPTGTKNLYFSPYAAGFMNFTCGSSAQDSFTTYKALFTGLGLDQASLCGTISAGGTVTIGPTGAAPLNLNPTTYQPGPSSVCLLGGSTALTGIGNLYLNGIPYVAASASIGAYLGGT